VRQIRESNLKKKVDYDGGVKDWEKRKAEFSAKLNQQHEEVEAMRAAYQSCSEDGLLEYWSQVLFHSEYPENFPKSFALDYVTETQMLVVDYELPDIECLPKVKETQIYCSSK